MADVSKITVGGSTYDLKDAFARESIASIIQESVFEVHYEDGQFILYWAGAAGTCPYSTQLDGTDYGLYFTY